MIVRQDWQGNGEASSRGPIGQGWPGWGLVLGYRLCLETGSRSCCQGAGAQVPWAFTLSPLGLECWSWSCSLLRLMLV